MFFSFPGKFPLFPGNAFIFPGKFPDISGKCFYISGKISHYFREMFFSSSEKISRYFRKISYFRENISRKNPSFTYPFACFFSVLIWKIFEMSSSARTATNIMLDSAYMSGFTIFFVIE